MVSQARASRLSSRQAPWVEAGSILVVLSPHLDDAVLSCGALIADASRCGADVLVVTVFNGRPIPPISDAAKRLHALWGLADGCAIEEREREDDAALRLVGARTRRLGLPEALYRNRRDGTPTYCVEADIFEASVTSEENMYALVEKAISDEIAAIRPDMVLAPLGLGGHIDHLLVSSAARRSSCDVLHYEDVPYVLSAHCQIGHSMVAAGVPRLHACTPYGWSAKIGAIESYTSQLRVLWPGPALWQEELTSYARSIGDGEPAERFWSSSIGPSDTRRDQPHTLP
jgi:LmbE family N-acetylglucosaminyl deacetylase